MKIKHAIGVLKNRLPSLKQLPIYICNKEDHTKAISWIMCYIMLHNFLNTEKEDSTIYRPNTIVPEDEIEVDEVDQDIDPESERAARNEWRDRMRIYLYHNRDD